MGIVLPQRKHVYYSLNKTITFLVLKYFGPDFRKQPSRVIFTNYTFSTNQSPLIFCASIPALLNHGIHLVCSAGMLNPPVSQQTNFVIQYYPKTVTLTPEQSPDSTFFIVRFFTLMDCH